MTKNISKTGLSSKTESYLKTILSFGAIIYGLGFLVVSVHLSRYDISPFGILRLQYIMAGVWLLLPLLMMLFVAFWAAAYAHELFSQKSSEHTMSRWRFVRVPLKILIVMFMVFGICGFIFHILSSSTPVLAVKFSIIRISDILKVGAFCIGLSFCCVVTWAFLSDIRTRTGSLSFNDLFWGAGYTGATLAVFLGYLGFFATNLYPSIPAHIGGGSPVEMKVILKTSEQNSQIDTLLGITNSTVLSPPLKLLLITDKSYFIADRNRNGISIEIPKDIVSIAIFGSHEKNKQVKPNKADAGDSH